MKFCKDCVHFRAGGSLYNPYAGGAVRWPSWCMAPILMRIEPVMGDRVHKEGVESDPTKQRASESGCGIDAQWFEQKPPAPPLPEPGSIVLIQVPKRPSIWDSIFGY